MSELVSISVAKSEIDKWLSVRRVSEKRRKSFQDIVEELAEHVSEGRIVFDEASGKLIQKLEFPLGETGSIRQLEFKPRLQSGEVRQVSLSLGAKTGDGDGRLIAHIAAATSHPSAMILKLDTYDYNIASNIALFFL